MNFFEDIAIGERRGLGSHLFTAEEIKRFALAYDPQPFHVDENAARGSPFGALCASGWHTLAVWMKLNVQGMKGREAEMNAAGLPCAKQGPSPGFDGLQWLKPVYAGDTVGFEMEVVATNESRSRPEWGLVSTRNTGRNQHGDVVITFVVHVFIERRRKKPD